MQPAIIQAIDACRSRLTGRLELEAGVMRSRIDWRDGEVVGAELTFGYRSVAQALVLADRISVGALDVLWASSAMDAPDPEVLAALGVEETPETLSQLQWVARLCAALSLAQSARLDSYASPEANFSSPVPGQRLLEALEHV